jgi:hypothetical protein
MRNNKTATLRAESEGKYYASGNKHWKTEFRIIAGK